MCFRSRECLDDGNHQGIGCESLFHRRDINRWVVLLLMAIITLFRKAHTRLEGLCFVLRSGQERMSVIRVSWWNNGDAQHSSYISAVCNLYCGWGPLYGPGPGYIVRMKGWINCDKCRCTVLDVPVLYSMLMVKFWTYLASTLDAFELAGGISSAHG